MPQSWEGLKHAARSRLKTWLPGPYGKDVNLPSPDLGGETGKATKAGYEQVKKLATKPTKSTKEQEPTPEEIGKSIKSSLEQFKKRKK